MKKAINMASALNIGANIESYYGQKKGEAKLPQYICRPEINPRSLLLHHCGQLTHWWFPQLQVLQQLLPALHLQAQF